MRGPIDYIVVGFTGNNFDGSVLNALKDAVENGTINLIALSFIRKDENGEVTTLDISDIGNGEYVMELSRNIDQENELIDEEDIEEVADLLQPDTAAGLLVIEHTWALPLKKALVDANGFLIADGRIHPDAALELDKV